jgi:phosphoheptose isomerase
MEPIEHFRRNFPDSISAKQQALKTAPPAIDRAATVLTRALSGGARVLCCGNGGSTADARHFSCELLNHTLWAAYRSSRCVAVTAARSPLQDGDKENTRTRIFHGAHPGSTFAGHPLTL